MNLVRLANRPQLRIELGGRAYLFSELTIGALADLQAWIEANTPMPFADLDEHIDAVWPGFQDRLRKHVNVLMKDWPPKVGTEEGGQALDSDAGWTELFYHGLRVHQPWTTREDATTFWKALFLDNAEKAIRIVRAMYGADPLPRYVIDPGPGRRLKRKKPAPIEWELVFRAAAQRLRFTTEQVCRHTYSQIMNALDYSDPNDSSKGLTPFNSFQELAEMFE